MFKAGHFFIILGLVVDVIGARMIIQPILNLRAASDFYRSPFDRFRRSFSSSSSFRLGHFSSTADNLRNLSESVDRRIRDLEERLERSFGAIERTDNSERTQDETQTDIHQRYASVGYIVLGFGFFLQIAGVLLLSGILYGN